MRIAFTFLDERRRIIDGTSVYVKGSVLQEKRQFIDDYSFEMFHLVDELLLQGDLTQAGQAVLEAESALWTLEQLLCLAPELVGNGQFSLQFRSM